MKMNSLASMVLVALSLNSASLLACEGEAEAHAEGANPHSVALAEAGPTQAKFQVKGIMCKSCEKHISSELTKVQGVKSVTFEKAPVAKSAQKKAHAPKTAIFALVTFTPGVQVAPSTLTEAFEKAGYTLTQ